MKAFAADNWEIIVVGNRQPGFAPFNKCKALNDGIDQAKGDVLTFLDCDALVGPRWLDAVDLVDWSTTRRLCYRVRYLAKPEADAVLAGGPWHHYFEQANYETLRRAYEAYGRPTSTRYRPELKPWGNSQFSVHRRWLGELRFDDSFVGRGFEDLDFLCRFELKHGDDYSAVIMTDPAHALIHLEHAYEPTWRTPALERANLARWKAKGR